MYTHNGTRPPTFRLLTLPFPFTADDVARVFRKKAHELHPDHGGDNDSLRILLGEREQAIRWLNTPRPEPKPRPSIEEWFGWDVHYRWRASRKGNPWIQVAGYSATVFPSGNGYKFVVNDPEGKTRFGRPVVGSSDEAKRLALLVIQLMEMECHNHEWH